MVVLYVLLYMIIAWITVGILVKADLGLEPGDGFVIIIAIFWPIFWVCYISYQIGKYPCSWIYKGFDLFTTFIAKRM